MGRIHSGNSPFDYSARLITFPFFFLLFRAKHLIVWISPPWHLSLSLFLIYYAYFWLGGKLVTMYTGSETTHLTWLFIYHTVPWLVFITPLKIQRWPHHFSHTCSPLITFARAFFKLANIECVSINFKKKSCSRIISEITIPAGGVRFNVFVQYCQISPRSQSFCVKMCCWKNYELKNNMKTKHNIEKILYINAS